MDESELEQIRRARLEQLKAGSGGAGGGWGGNSSASNEQNQQQDEARQTILDQILDPKAADRLSRIRLVKEQRATDMENRLISLAQAGQLRQKVTEEQLKDFLSAVADKEEREKEKIVVTRRKGWDDDDDLLDL